MKCVPDTGAMVTCAGLALLHKLNMAQGALILEVSNGKNSNIDKRQSVNRL